VDTTRHPREPTSTGDRSPPAPAEAPGPGPGASPPADLGPAEPATGADQVNRTVPPVVNPPLVALALTVLFLLVLLVAVLLGPDRDRASADEPASLAPAPVVDVADPRPTGR